MIEQNQAIGAAHVIPAEKVACPVVLSVLSFFAVDFVPPGSSELVDYAPRLPTVGQVPSSLQPRVACR